MKDDQILEKIYENMSDQENNKITDPSKIRYIVEGIAMNYGLANIDTKYVKATLSLMQGIDNVIAHSESVYASFNYEDIEYIIKTNKGNLRLYSIKLKD